MIDPLVHLAAICAAYAVWLVMGGQKAAPPILALAGAVFVGLHAPLAVLWIAFTCAEAALLFAWLRRKDRQSNWRQYGMYLVLPNFLIVDVHPFAFGFNVETLAISFATIRIFMTGKQLLAARKTEPLAAAWWIPAAAFYLPAIMVGPVFSGTQLRKQAEGAAPAATPWLRDYRMILQGLILAALLNPGAGALVDYLQDPEFPSPWPDWATAPILFAQLFFAFWGQSLIAEHTSRLFGFDLPQNFDAPWKANNIREFWNRWHRSMAQFVMQYIFLPLQLKGVNPRLATVSAFVFMGVWHNLSPGYALWGLAHGLLLAFWPKGEMPANRQSLARIATWGLVISLSYVANYGSLA